MDTTIPPPIQQYIGLGDSISIDDYAGGPGRGAISLLHTNRDQDFPEFRGHDLVSAHPEIELTSLAQDGVTSRGILENQVTRIPRNDGSRTLFTLTAGGNDLLAVLYMNGTLLAEDGSKAVSRVRAIIGSALHRYPEALMVVATIYDPTDGVGDLIHPGAPLQREHGVFLRVNDGIRELADGKQVFVADLHTHFLGHGAHHDDPANPHHDPADPTPWLIQSIEPNARGASEVRRVFWQTLVEAGWVEA